MNRFRKNSPSILEGKILRERKEKGKLFDINSKYHNLWSFTILEILESEHGTDLKKVIKPWQLLEFETFKVLRDLNLIIRYSQTYSSLNDPLKSNDFLIYSRSRELLRIVECKFIEIQLKEIKYKLKYCKAVIDKFKEGIVYVVNNEFYSLLLKEYPVALSLRRVVNVKGLQSLMKLY